MTARETSRTEMAQPAGESLAPNVALPWIVQLRFLLVAGEAALVLFLGEHGGPGKWALCGTVIGLQLLANLWIVHFAHRRGSDFEHMLGFVFALDALALT